MLNEWCRTIRSGDYMSNTRPSHIDFSAVLKHKLLWRVISVSGKATGTIWLEEAENRQEAVLGILLGEPSLFGKGIGRAAIRLALAEARDFFSFRRITLHVRTGNERAIACYKACGFTKSGEGEKAAAAGIKIPFITMEYLL